MHKQITRPATGKLRTIVADKLGADKFKSQSHNELGFRNETLDNLVIVFRNGVRLHVERAAMSHFSNGCLIIREGLTTEFGIKADVDNQFIAGEPVIDDVASAWCDTMGIRRDQREHNAIPEFLSGRNFARTYGVIATLDQAEIRRNGAVYLREFDILVVINDGTGRSIPPHPFSRLGQIASVEADCQLGPQNKGYGVYFRIIDRFMKFGGRYFNVGGHIVYVQAEEPQDVQLEDGVYVTTHSRTNYGNGEAVQRTTYYSFETANKTLPLFFSELEAKTLGHPDDIYKKEIERLKFEVESEKATYKLNLAREEAELNRQRHELEKEKTRWETEQDQREHLFRCKEHDLRSEQVMLKYRLDEKSEHRKAWLEIIKYVPAIIGGLITIATVISKLKEDGKNG